MLTCIAVDDEPLALKLLEDNISKVPFLQWIASCRNVYEAMKIMEESRIDLIFIDIQMLGLTGLQSIGSLEKKPLVIFVTAYKQYALKSYDLSVVNYLAKPVSLERFIKACSRAKELHKLKSGKNPQAPTPSADYFFLNADYSQIKNMFNDIIWMEGVRDYVKIHLKNDPKPLLFRSRLKIIELELPASKFVRIHKSYTVAIDSITSIHKNNLFIKNTKLPIGETFRQAVENLVRKREMNFRSVLRRANE